MKHLAGSIAFALAWTVSAHTQEWIEQPVTFWRDPAFQKAFMGSYGMRAEIEPRVTVVEKEIMDKVVA
ncbi:MAG: hypothetical protein WCU90_11510, partial [Kiritimatiellia bacterium]